MPSGIQQSDDVNAQLLLRNSDPGRTMIKAFSGREPTRRAGNGQGPENEFGPELLEPYVGSAIPARSAWAERDVALVATLGPSGTGVSEVVSLTLGSLRRDLSGRQPLVTNGTGEARVTPLSPALAELIDAYLASRDEWYGGGADDEALFLGASGAPMTSSQVHYLVQPLRENRTRRPGAGGAAVHALHATLAAEALAHGQRCSGMPGPSPTGPTSCCNETEGALRRRSSKTLMHRMSLIEVCGVIDACLLPFT
jgi:hypothetical protein